MKAGEHPAITDLFSESMELDQQWFVLHTLSRQEKAVAADLESRGIRYFLPLINEVRYYGRRKIRVALPLFAGYLFVRATKEQTYLADRTGRLVSIITVARQKQLNWELKNLSLALANNATLDPYPSLKVGTRVEVRSGPLRGLQGFIESRTDNQRLILQVEMLGRAVSLQIDVGLLDPI